MHRLPGNIRSKPGMKLLRGIYIFWIFFRYGLDELALSSAPQSGLRTLGRLITLGRNLDAPRGQRLRMALEKLARFSSSSARCFPPGATCCRPTSPPS